MAHRPPGLTVQIDEAEAQTSPPSPPSQHMESEDFCASSICRLRLAASSGIPTGAGDVAEWLKAAVC